ncbi:hypothetical protein K402DRAFT_159158 [Aulographum hederae CBS 113979]|uniref:Uncharacterized protein n=1 Tax=Aulographum hederae CBS 113979 TaxID=1176131 RepID=A0A6G1GRQ7_9PEZI|nr:hypothetical protein K402DRAFT_159158 [Aulographum hederae CBS 113979]
MGRSRLPRLPSLTPSPPPTPPPPPPKKEEKEKKKKKKEKKRRGRPLGSKNKATIERENRERGLPSPEDSDPPHPAKRGRGRPRGSKTKPKNPPPASAAITPSDPSPQVAAAAATTPPQQGLHVAAADEDYGLDAIEAWNNANPSPLSSTPTGTFEEWIREGSPQRQQQRELERQQQEQGQQQQSSFPPHRARSPTPEPMSVIPPPELSVLDELLEDMDPAWENMIAPAARPVQPVLPAYEGVWQTGAASLQQHVNPASPPHWRHLEPVRQQHEFAWNGLAKQRPLPAYESVRGHTVHVNPAIPPQWRHLETVRQQHEFGWDGLAEQRPLPPYESVRGHMVTPQMLQDLNTPGHDCFGNSGRPDGFPYDHPPRRQYWG